jgi:hypothetical protein
MGKLVYKTSYYLKNEIMDSSEFDTYEEALPWFENFVEFNNAVPGPTVCDKVWYWTHDTSEFIILMDVKTQ